MLATLTGAVAHESATEILGLLKELGIAGVDVTYRESVAKFLHGLDLFSLVLDLGPLKNVTVEFLITLLPPWKSKGMGYEGRRRRLMGVYTQVRTPLPSA